MRGPAEAIAHLDAALARSGEDIVLQRLTLGPGGAQIPFSVDCRALVRGYEPHELVNGITEQDAKVILSPTEIERAQWPGPAVGDVAGDRRVPRNGDRMIIAGRARRVEAAAPLYMAGVLVRIEARVQGSAAAAA